MIYPINESLERLMESFTDPETGELKEEWIDPETGEVYPLTEDLMNTLVEMFQMEFDEKIVELRNQYINLTAEAEAIKAEKMKLADRQKKAEDRAERTKRWLAYLLKGEKFQKDAVRISYRRSEEVKFDNDDPEKFVLWADKNFPSLLKYADPVPKKDDIKKAIKAGMEVDFAHIEPKNNILVK